MERTIEVIVSKKDHDRVYAAIENLLTELKLGEAAFLHSRSNLVGHDEPCYICNEPCDKISANGGLWPVGIIGLRLPGRMAWCHQKCVFNELRSTAAAK